MPSSTAQWMWFWFFVVGTFGGWGFIALLIYHLRNEYNDSRRRK